MKECGCYDPGFILRLLLDEQSGRALGVWLKEQMSVLTRLPEFDSLSQRDFVWMSEAAPQQGLEEIISISRYPQDHLRRISELSLDVKGVQGLKKLLTLFIEMIQQGVYLTRLTFSTPASEAEAARVHLMIRLLRAILIKVNSGMLLLPDNTTSGLDRLSFLGNTLNEAHLVYNEALPAAIKESLNAGRSHALNALISTLKLPGLNVAYFNVISPSLMNTIDEQLQALTIIMAVSGLTGLAASPDAKTTDRIIHTTRARGRSAVFHPASAQMVIELDPAVFTLMKISPDATELALCLHNIRNATVDINIQTETIGLPEGEWLDLLSDQKIVISREKNIHLNPLSSIWLQYSM